MLGHALIVLVGGLSLDAAAQTLPWTPTTAGPNGVAATRTPTYNWSAVYPATSYDLRVETGGGGAVFTNNYPLGDAGCAGGVGACGVTPAVQLANGAAFRWSVRAINSAGSSDWSAPTGFTVLALPQAPVPIAPQGIITAAPTFVWAAAPDAAEYELLVTGSPGWEYLLSLSQAGCPTNTGTCSYTPPDLFSDPYGHAWLVRGANFVGYGPTSHQVPIFVVSPDGRPAPPYPQTPVGTVTTLTPQFLWIPTIGSTGYTLRLMSSGNVVIEDSLTLSQALCPTNGILCGYTPAVQLANGTTYQWQVAASNAAGSSAYGEAATFTTSGSAVPAPPVLGQPGGNIPTVTPMFLWTPSQFATAYVLRVQEGVPAGATVIDETLTLAQALCPANTGACGFVPTAPLLEGTVYIWKVAARNAAGTGPFSAYGAFTTPMGGPPPVPNPGAPNGSAAESTPMFLWSPAQGATHYDWRVRTPAGAEVVSASLTLSLALCPTNVGACGYVPPAPLSPATAYMWSVQARNASGASGFSADVAFSVANAAAIPLVPMPGNPSGPIGTLQPMLLWTPSSNATAYTVRVMAGSSILFGPTLTLAEALCAANSGACGYTVPAQLAPATEYTWQVSASSAAGASAFSAPRRFFTP
jgi:hypothetical protein